MSSEFKLSTILPHSKRMILIDKIISYAETSLIAEVKITSNSYFLNQQKELPAWVISEYMAQAISAWSGISRLKEGKKIENGYLLGIRRFKSTQPTFSLNCILTIEINQVLQDEAGVGVFNCIAQENNQNCVSCVLTVFQKQS